MGFGVPVNIPAPNNTMKLKWANIMLMLAILIWVASPTYAQKRRSKSLNPKAWYFGAEGGGNVYFGDLKYWDYIPNIEYGELTYGYGLKFGKLLSPKFLIQSRLHFSKLSGTKRTPNLLRTFNTNTSEISLSLQMNLSQIFNSRPMLNKLSLWGEVGVGAARWQSLMYNTQSGDTLANLHWGSKEYKSSIMLPMALDIKYYFNKNIALNLYSALRFVNSDSLDAKAGGIKFDYYWYTGLGINYYWSLKRSPRKKIAMVSKKRADAMPLLDYMSIDPFQDPEVKRITKKEYLKQEEAKGQESANSSNPYLVEFWVPKHANNKKFQVLVSIKKRGITGNGFFRLTLPSGFYPQSPHVKEVTYTRLGYNYDFDFYLPMNKDTLLIPLDIIISEGEDGTYPLFIEGEVMNQEGETFKIKNAQYVQIGPDVAYNAVPTSSNGSQASSSKSAYVNPTNVSEVKEEAKGDHTYRIQILACRKPSKKVDEFLKKHHIEQKVFLYEADRWWRYSIYALSTMKDAESHLQLIRNQHHIAKAFIVEFENGKRSVPKNQPKVIVSQKSGGIHYQNAPSNWNQKRNTQVVNQTKINKKEAKSEQQQSQFQPVQDQDNISVYRIEIAVSPGYPIPLRQLQHWVANEKISEWTYKTDYRYTVGRFENEQVAKAFLKYVRMQFALPDAHLVETKGKAWLKVVR